MALATGAGVGGARVAWKGEVRRCAGLARSEGERVARAADAPGTGDTGLAR